MGHRLGSRHSASRRVHAQDDGFHFVVLGSFGEGLDNVVAIDGCGGAGALAGDHIAFSIDDGDVGVFGLLFQALCISFGLDDFAYPVLGFEVVLYVLCKTQGVNESGFLGLVGQKACEAVGHTGKVLGCEAPVGGHGGKCILPGAVDVGTDLLAVGIAHVGTGIYFAGTLVGTRGGTYQLHVHAQFVEQPFVEHHFGTQTAEIDGSGGVYGNGIGGGGQEVFGLGVGLAIGYDRLVAVVVEGFQGFLQLLGLCPAEVAAAEVEVESLDTLVGGGIFNGAEQLRQAGSCSVAEEGHEFVGL